MNIFKKLMTAVLAFGLAASLNAFAADEAPDVLVKRISQDVLDTAKSDKDIQHGNQKKVLDLVNAKILPYVDFQRMTQLAAGPAWRNTTPDQQKQLTEQFRDLLVFTYSGAISSIKDQKLQFQPLRMDAGATDGVEVRSQVLQPRGEPIQLNYRLEKIDGGWKIYDLNVLGAWLVETYKGNFAAEISKGGVDGLIKTLGDKNKKLADAAAKSAK
ncbi:MAG: ABC transporter substrate-binding protein [Burkholderiaceae bacterium]|nr:ABC transporter substrate-binding protein [Burkholderiaceae bacterium]